MAWGGKGISWFCSSRWDLSLGFQTLTKTALHFLFHFPTDSIFCQDSPWIYSARKCCVSVTPGINHFLCDTHQAPQPTNHGQDLAPHGWWSLGTSQCPEPGPHLSRGPCCRGLCPENRRWSQGPTIHRQTQHPGQHFSTLNLSYCGNRAYQFISSWFKARISRLSWSLALMVKCPCC